MAPEATGHWIGRVPDEQLVRTAGGPAYRRGVELHRRRHVVALQVGATVEATIRGTGGAHYVVSLRSVTSRAGVPSWGASCTCPVGFDCKHGVAVFLAAREAVRAAAATPRTPAWELALAPITQDDAGDGERAPLALELRTIGLGERPLTGVAARPLRLGRRGRWIATGATWTDLESPYGRHAVRDDQRRAVLALARAFRAGQSSLTGWYGKEVHLEPVGPELWLHLQRLDDAGVALVDPQGAPVPVGPAVQASFDLDEDEDGLLITPVVTLDDRPVDDYVLLGDPPHGAAVRGEHGLCLRPLAAPIAPGATRLFRDGRRLRVPRADVPRFFADHLPALRHAAPVTTRSGLVALPEIGPPRLRLSVDFRAAHTAWIEWSWVYRVGDDDRAVPLADRSPAARVSFRDHAAEQALLDALAAGPLAGRRDLIVPVRDRPRLVSPVSLGGMATATFVEHVLPLLRDHPAVDVVETGSPAQYGAATTEPVVRLAVDERPAERDWFDLAVTVTVDGEHVPIADLVTALSRGATRLLLPSGTHFPLSSPALTRLRELLEEARSLVDPERGTLAVSPYQVAFWEQLVGLGVVDRQCEAFTQRVDRLRGALAEDASSGFETPPGLRATLRGYQEQGAAWGATLWDAGLGGLLADDMGLGKTLQALALLERARHRGDLGDPALVVAPTSVLPVWLDEAARFAPGLRVVGVTRTAGKRGTSLAADIAGADVVVTSYTLVRLGEEDYLAQRWRAVVLDEAQAVKNFRAKTYQVVRRLQREFTLAMTGTPLENSLMDLWALLSLSSPGLFPDPEAFTLDYRTPIEVGGDAVRLAAFRRTIRPFVLRRTKEQVAPELPPKQEQTLLVPLPPAHRRLYDTHLHRERQRVLGLLDDLDRNRVAVLSALTTLRQMALDPGLVDPAYAGRVAPAKLDLLVEHVGEVHAEGHRVLVFSQFTRFLRQARDRLEAAGLRTEYLDGRTRDRAATIAAFRGGDAAAFLISLKAGGFGLTLTEADYVYVLDPWWNPAAEAQAVDRTHRIGQDKPVLVYRLVASGTIEEKVRDLQEAKRELVAKVVDDGAAFAAALGAADLRDLLT